MLYGFIYKVQWTAFCSILFTFAWVWWVCVYCMLLVYMWRPEEDFKCPAQHAKKWDSLWNFHKICQWALFLCMSLPPLFCFVDCFPLGKQTFLCSLFPCYVHFINMSYSLLKILICLLRILYLVLWHNILMLISKLENETPNKRDAFNIVFL